MHFKALPLALVATGACLVTFAAAAGADAGKPPALGTPALAATPGKTTPALASADAAIRLPRGYRIVGSGALNAAAGRQTRGIATCPANKVPLSGGVFVTSTSTAANVNSSFPFGNGWAADVNNASGADTIFTVSVVCAAKPKLYAVVQSTQAINVAGRQDFADATCPVGSLPLGGGAFSNSTSLAVNMNTTVPDGTSWDVDMNNASASDTLFSAFAVCGKLKNYTIANGSGVTTDNPPGLQSLASATCPAPTHVIGGGVFSNSGNVDVNINTTAPNGTTSWDSFMNNASVFDAGLVSIAVCAGA